MNQKILFNVLILGVFGLGCLLPSTSAEIVAFSDVWTKELQESFSTCRSRLPSIISADDLKWVPNIKTYYAKYSDQISLFRIIDIFAAGHEKESLDKVRCLFESPCLFATIDATTANANGFDSNYQACTGEKITVSTRYSPEGHYDKVFYHKNGTAAYKAVYAPALTDGKSFVLYISCISDGSFGFFVYTTRPALSAYTRHIIKDYLDNAGFKDHFRVSTSYMSTSCKNRVE